MLPATSMPIGVSYQGLNLTDWQPRLDRHRLYKDLYYLQKALLKNVQIQQYRQYKEGKEQVPKYKPCGTPALKVTHLELAPGNTILCFLLSQQPENHLRRVLDITWVLMTEMLSFCDIIWEVA